MENKTEDIFDLVEKATAGDGEALEALVLSVKDLVFNLSLRMLGTFADAEDATQDILLKMITHLSSFKKESAFSTWVFRIAANHLKTYQKHMFAQHPLSFEYYGDDIQNANIRDVPDVTQNVDKALLAEELKMSCTNVMLQCLDPDSRCIFVLGTMFQLDSRIAGEILGLSPEAYRQRLSRARKKMADFLRAYCGSYGDGTCNCKERINYAIQTHRLDPGHLDYTGATVIPRQTMLEVKDAMEEIDDLAQLFSFGKIYEAPKWSTQFLRDFLNSTSLSVVKDA